MPVQQNQTPMQQQFHTYCDVNYLQSALGIVNLSRITLTRDLSYRFYPHFHPYVGELVKRLVEGSVVGLQATDTDYETNKDGTYAELPDSTRVAFAADVEVDLDDGEKLKIQGGKQLFLPDGTQLELSSDGTKVTLPGSFIVTQPRGLKFNLIGGSTRLVAFGEKLKLCVDQKLRLPEGILVNLKAGTEFILQACKPLPKLFEKIFGAYTPSDLVERPHPANDLDFSSSGAYSVYNWELFYHVPFTIAVNLSKNMRYEEAQQWFHYIFDPTDDSSGPTPERFWKVRPFQYTDIKMIEEILVNLSTRADPQLYGETVYSIDAWKESPFRPHLVARYRQTAYMFKTVMAYLDNLIAWGDSLFREESGESVDEATQLYVLAANILGPRSQEVPKKGSVRPKTYVNMKSDMDRFGNVLCEIEPEMPFDIAPYPTETVAIDRFSSLVSSGSALYFCVPANDKLLSYWDTVADRLFKIHNSLNIQGIFRQLPLFEPPIDPGLLAKAAAAGLDVAAIISGANQPLPLVRFQFLVQKAFEICQEVKSLGNSLLSAMEKEDNEALFVLRAKHESTILKLAEKAKYAQWQEASKATEGLQESLLNSIWRYIYYEKLLGKQENEIQIPAELDALDKSSLEKMKFKASEPTVDRRSIEVDIKKDAGDESGGKMISSYEAKELEFLKWAQFSQDAASALEFVGAFLNLIPTVDADIKPIGVGAGVHIGGMNLSQMLSGIASASRGVASRLNYEASKVAKIGGYARREQEWAFQSNVVAGDITQVFKQLRAAQIREAIAEWEWKNHQQQIVFSEEIERFLTEEKKGKKTNQAFYSWMKREVKGLYAQCFQFAFDVAKKAEHALQHELGDPTLSFLQFTYLSGKEGLLAGEKLYLDIKRMEMSYHELNQREYELTKNVSLLQVDPLALLQLRATGQCKFSLPEELFDMDCPSHYFRRIRSVSITIPSVTGPYCSINCTLTLQKSTIRKSSLLSGDQYIRESAEDDRFSDYFGSIQSIVTSTAQDDTGLFETNLHDERYLPFEGSGVISEWQLKLPADVRQFDYDTISDVILHIRYTAREAGALLEEKATENLKTCISEAQAAGSVLLFSMRHEFPTEWAKFKNAKIDLKSNPKIMAELAFDIKPEHYPFWSRDLQISLKRLEILVAPSKETKQSVGVYDSLNAIVQLATLRKDASMKNIMRGKLSVLPAAIGTLALYFDDNSMRDIFLALTWGKGN
jgi:hypothetical protein